MTDIRHYSDQELSLLFLNDEFFYNEFNRAVVRDNFSIIEEVAIEYFVFNQDQLEDLRETFEKEVEQFNS